MVQYKLNGLSRAFAHAILLAAYMECGQGDSVVPVTAAVVDTVYIFRSCAILSTVLIRLGRQQ